MRNKKQIRRKLAILRKLITSGKIFSAILLSIFLLIILVNEEIVAILMSLVRLFVRVRLFYDLVVFQ